MSGFPFLLGELSLELLPAKALWWKEGATMIVSDVQVGKTVSSKRELNAPVKSFTSDLDRLNALAKFYRVKKIWVLGDFFHSEYNATWKEVVDWRNQQPDIEVSLINGNHDLLNESYYEQAGIHLLPQVVVRDVVFCREAESFDSMYTVYGRIHPGISMEQEGSDVRNLPCFYYHEQQLTMPAFCSLTEYSLLSPEKGSMVFAIAGKEVVTMKY